MSDPVELAPDEKLCPFCAETIKKAAIRCRYCHSDLPAENGAATPAATTEPELDVEEAPARTPGDDVSPVEAGPRAAPLLASFRLLVGLLVLCLVLVCVTTYAWWRSDHAADSAKAGAITSMSARDAGMEAAAKLTQQVLSYNWESLDQDIKSTEAVLAPSFRSEYDKTMASVRAQTIKNQVKLTASVRAASVVSATPQKVVALVFVNQVTVAKGTTNQRLDQNRVLVTLTRHGGEWRVSKMDAF